MENKNLIRNPLLTVALAGTAIALNMSSTAAHAVAVKGMSSCGSWIAARQAQNVAATVDKFWLIGYLSGISVGSGKDLLRNTDIDSAALWVDNYCRENPLDKVNEAGAHLARELAKKEGQ